VSLRSTPAPLIARLGGLPCTVIEALSTALPARLDQIDELERRRQVMCKELVDVLFAAIHGAEPEVRHALLAVKRDCFNGRPLSIHREKPGWNFVREAAGELADRLTEIEEKIETEKRAFIAEFEAATAKQHERLISVLDQPMFACGLAVSSGTVAREIHRLHRVPQKEYGRREKRLVSTMLRYVTRASLKLSPFSTFTPVGLCWVDDDSPASLSLAGGAPSHRSLVRLRRHVFDRCTDMLVGYIPFRSKCLVALNNSAVRIADGRHLFRRRGHYRHDAETNTLLYHKECLVRASLTDAVSEHAGNLLSLGPIPYGDFIRALAGPESAQAALPEILKRLDELFDIGFLTLVPPWNADEGHLERLLVRELRTLPADPKLEKLIGHLERLLALEDGFLTCTDPANAYENMNRLVNDLLLSSAELGNMPAGMRFPVISYHDIYQDVWCAPVSRPDAAMVSAWRKPLQQALNSIEPIVRYARLYDHQIDFLYTLGVSLRENHPNSHQLPLLQVVDEAKNLWQDFMRFQKQTRDGQSWKETWNPRGLEVLNRLALARKAGAQALDSCVVKGPDSHHVRGDVLNLAIADLPDRFTQSFSGGCLFLQPGAADGSLWMLNRIKEGTGRFASRYTPLMPAVVRDSYTRHLTSRSAYQVEGEEVQLLDIQHIQGDTLNVHAQQTSRVLVLTTSQTSVPAEQLLTLQDLVINIEQDGWPQLRDVKGHRYLPVYLGLGSYDYMPTLVKFICAFGPTELMAVFPKPFKQEIDGVVRQDRTVMGNVVLHRRSWSVPTQELQRCLDGLNDVEAFTALHRWRCKHGIPERVFADEREMHPLKTTFRYKPQYLDFTSPLFIPILRNIAGSGDKRVDLSEVLPGPDEFPRDSSGQAWAVEILVDSLSLRPDAHEAEIEARVTPGLVTCESDATIASGIGRVFSNSPAEAVGP
jgi:lantibiotic biosynthesis dehydratase-like protein